MIATLPNGTQAKINQAQSDGGVKEAKSVIAQWLGIPGFDRYVVLRIDATKEFIAAIGGVNVYVKSSNCLRYKTGCTGDTLDYDDTWGHLHIHLKEGLQHLNGEQAVAYMRFRHDWCSDPCRIMRQQQVLRALVDKLKGDRFNTLVHLGNLLGVFRKVRADRLYRLGAALDRRLLSRNAELGDREQPGALHRRRQSARLRRFAGSRYRGACAVGRDDARRARRPRCRRPMRSR